MKWTNTEFAVADLTETSAAHSKLQIAFNIISEVYSDMRGASFSVDEIEDLIAILNIAMNRCLKRINYEKGRLIEGGLDEH